MEGGKMRGFWRYGIGLVPRKRNRRGRKDNKEVSGVKDAKVKKEEAKNKRYIKDINDAKSVWGTKDKKDYAVAMDDFAKHMRKYIGETVTVIAKSGGASGKSFTGLLSNVSPYYIQLLSQTGPKPFCILTNACNNWKKAICCNNYSAGAKPPFAGCSHIWTRNAYGAVIYIPVEKIVSFIHNSL